VGAFDKKHLDFFGPENAVCHLRKRVAVKLILGFAKAEFSVNVGSQETMWR